MIKTILFDLDGTLLPMFGDDFVKLYFKNLVKKFAPLGYNPEKIIKWVWAGTEAMTNNDGSKTNLDAFWDTFEKLSGMDVKKDISIFDEFYLNEFDNVKELVPQGYTLRPLFDRLKSKGYRLVLATNPFFPYNAAITRLNWIGLKIDDFEYISTMENSCYTKPNLKYYEDILNKINEKPENCLMVGNNPIEDVSIKELGAKIFFMPKYIENKSNVDYSMYDQGDFDDLEKYLENE